MDWCILRSPELPERESLSKRVSLLSRYGTWALRFVLSASALMQLARDKSERLMLRPSTCHPRIGPGVSAGATLCVPNRSGSLNRKGVVSGSLSAAPLFQPCPSVVRLVGSLGAGEVDERKLRDSLLLPAGLAVLLHGPHNDLKVGGEMGWEWGLG